MRLQCLPPPVCACAPERAGLPITIIEDEVSIVSQLGPRPRSTLIGCITGPCDFSKVVKYAELVIFLDDKPVWGLTLDVCSR